MNQDRITSMNGIDVATLDFKDIRWEFGVYQYVSTGSGRNKQYSSWIGVRTPMGEIKETVWYQLAETLIRRKGEQQLLGHLIQWESEHNYTNDSPDTVRKKAIQLHVDRIFDNPRWVDFVSFNCRFRPEALEDAHLVTVINECCQEPGVVTQEQIDASANGTVACPCCGRWSPFRVLEQAIQTESAARQTEEAKGGMHLC